MSSIYHNSTYHQPIFHHYVCISPLFQETPPFSSNYIMYKQHEIFHNTIFHVLSLKILLFIFFQNNINLSIKHLSSKCQPMVLVQYIHCLYTLYIYIAVLQCTPDWDCACLHRNGGQWDLNPQALRVTLRGSMIPSVLLSWRPSSLSNRTTCTSSIICQGHEL